MVGQWHSGPSFSMAYCSEIAFHLLLCLQQTWGIITSNSCQKNFNMKFKTLSARDSSGQEQQREHGNLNIKTYVSVPDVLRPRKMAELLQRFSAARDCFKLLCTAIWSGCALKPLLFSWIPFKIPESRCQNSGKAGKCSTYFKAQVPGWFSAMLFQPGPISAWFSGERLLLMLCWQAAAAVLQLLLGGSDHDDHLLKGWQAVELK